MLQFKSVHRVSNHFYVILIESFLSLLSYRFCRAYLLPLFFISCIATSQTNFITLHYHSSTSIHLLKLTLTGLFYHLSMLRLSRNPICNYYWYHYCTIYQFVLSNYVLYQQTIHAIYPKYNA